MKTMAKSQELFYELLPHPPYSPDLISSDILQTSTECSLEKKIGTYEEVITETEAYFESFIMLAYELFSPTVTDVII